METLTSTPDCVYCGTQLSEFEEKENLKDKLPEYMARPVCYGCWDQMENHGIELSPSYDWNPKLLSARLVT